MGKAITVIKHHEQKDLEKEIKRTKDGRYRLRVIKFDTKAMQKFNQIPEDMKSKILSNVYCSHCNETVRIVDFTATIVNQDRKGALDFYRLFAGDEAFRTGVADSLERALSVVQTGINTL